MATKHLICLFVFEVVAILPIALIIYWVKEHGGGFSWVKGDMKKFNYHPPFMMIGFIFVMGHAVISFRILPLAHRVKKYIHATLNLIAAIFVIVGLISVFQFHDEQGFPNLYSLHSWLGLVTVTIFFLQVVGGLAIFQDLVKGASDEIRGQYKPLHVVAGITIVTFAAVSMATGLQEKYAFSNPDKFSALAYTFNFTALSVFLWLATVIYILVAVEKQEPQSDQYSALPETSREQDSIN